MRYGVSTIRVSGWVNETSSTHSLTRMVPISFPFEVRFSFIHICVQTFFGIFRLKQELLKLALQRETRFERKLRATLHRAFDAPDRARSFLRRGELACVLHHLF